MEPQRKVTVTSSTYVSNCRVSTPVLLSQHPDTSASGHLRRQTLCKAPDLGHQPPTRSSCHQSSRLTTPTPHPHHSRPLSESSMPPELSGMVSALQVPLDPPKHPPDEEMQVNLLLEASPPPSPLVIEELETPLAKGRAEEVAGLQSLTLACVPPPRRYLTLVSQGHCLVPCPSGARETGPGQNTQGQFQGLNGVLGSSSTTRCHSC